PRPALFTLHDALPIFSRGERGFLVVAVDGLGALGPDLGTAAMRLLMIENAGAQVVSAHSAKELARELVMAWADRAETTSVGERRSEEHTSELQSLTNL